MNAAERIDVMIENDPAAIAALLHRAGHELSITKDLGGEAISALRTSLRSGTVDACLHLSQDDADWLPATKDLPTVGDTLRMVADRIVRRASVVAGTDGMTMSKLSYKLVANPLMWLDEGLGLLIRARMTTIHTVRDQVARG